MSHIIWLIMLKYALPIVLCMIMQAIFQEPWSELIPVGFHAKIRCKNDHQKMLRKRCLPNGFWSRFMVESGRINHTTYYILMAHKMGAPWTIKRQNEYIFCEENRYWVAVLGGGVSSVLIILLLLYFAASYYRRIDNYQAGFENRM